MQYRCTKDGDLGISFSSLAFSGTPIPDGYVEKVGPYYPKLGQEFDSASVTINGTSYMVLNLKVFKPAVLIYKFDIAADLEALSVAKAKLHGTTETFSEASFAMRGVKGFFGYLDANTGTWLQKREKR